MAGSVANQKVEPMTATYGEAVMQSENITCVADVTSSLNNKYFLFYTPAGVKHYAWFNTGAGVDPAVSGGTAHSVSISAGATAATVASALQAVLDVVTGFDCSVDGAVLTLTATTAGYAKHAHEGGGATGFTFEVNYYGDSAVDLGQCDGDITVTHEEKLVDITSHQTGSQVLSHISTGNKMSVTLSLKETSVNQLRKIFLGEGDSVMPDGTDVGSTEVFGFGTSRQFKQTIGRARKLVLHPVTLPASNNSRDITIWKAFPKFKDIKFSGESVLMVPVEFEVYPDYTIAGEVRMSAYGDGTQTLT